MKKRVSNHTLITTILGIFIFGVFILLNVPPAEATSQWSKKYKTPCSTCHTVFPRLNFYGEKFLRNGYQDPDNAKPDGDTMKKRINKDLLVDRITNLFGIRLNLTPLKVQESGVALAGEEKTKTTIGDAEWIQFFVAGSIYKNISFFTEMQFKDEEFHYSWWHIGFHNLMDSTAVNFFIGNVSPLDYGSHSNRLRIFAPIKNAVYDVKTANGSGDDSLGVSGSRPAIQYFGYKGYMVWWAGIGPGSHASDVNDKIFTWGGLRMEVPSESESDFEGSSVTIWAFQGDDGKNIAATDTTPAEFRTSTSKRYQLSGNLRYGTADVQAAYVWGDDEDGSLSTASKDKFEFSGVAVQAGYLIDHKWYPAVSYDRVEKDTGSGSTVSNHTITPAVSYVLKENIRMGFYATIDLNDETGHTKANTYLWNIRTMF